MGVTRADKRRLDELRVEVGMNESFKKTLMRSGLTWAGHLERMGDENCQREEEREERKTEIAMGDWIKKDLEKVREEWRKRPTDRRNWRLLKKNV